MAAGVKESEVSVEVDAKLSGRNQTDSRSNDARRVNNHRAVPFSYTCHCFLFLAHMSGTSRRNRRRCVEISNCFFSSSHSYQHLETTTTTDTRICGSANSERKPIGSVTHFLFRRRSDVVVSCCCLDKYSVDVNAITRLVGRSATRRTTSLHLHIGPGLRLYVIKFG